MRASEPDITTRAYHRHGVQNRLGRRKIKIAFSANRHVDAAIGLS
jgi:hypothetical protein